METSQVNPNSFIRFSVLHRFLHWVVMLGFIGLGLTGFSHKFSSQFWAQGVAFILGGQEWLGYWHRFWAVITYGGVVLHIGWLAYYKTLLKGRLTGPQTVFPRGKDLLDLYQHIRYFLGRGKVPKFDRFTYWEKVDYWAILVGMNTMGLTGLVMWFPEFFAAFIPGYFINLAQIIHLYEAIMAVALKFVIHIVTAHLRPEIYPMDRVIFSGRTTLERLKHERPAEWESLVGRVKVEAAAATAEIAVEQGLPGQREEEPAKEEGLKPE